MSYAVMEQSQGPVTITHSFGTIEVPADAVLQFVTPMMGFADRTFVLLPASRKGVWWFISTGDTPTTFVLADPFIAKTDYVVDLSESEREALVLHNAHDALALVLLVMPSSSGERPTGNFRAPLVFNLNARSVMQVVNRDERYGISEPVDLTLFELAPSADEASTDTPPPEAPRT